MEENNDEKAALEQALASYWSYEDYAIDEFYKPRIKKYEALSQSQQQLIPHYPDYLNQLLKAIETNGSFYKKVVLGVCSMWGVDPKSSAEWCKPSHLDMSKTVSILTQLAREWSSECQYERQLLTDRIEKHLLALNANSTILVPGAGTGRLVADLAQKGYYCEGNEYSYHMLVLSSYMLNSGLSKDQLTIYPYVHTFSHWQDRNAQLKSIKIPDFNVYEQLAGTQLMSMSAGSFVDCYGPNDKNIKVSDHFTMSQAMTTTRASAESKYDMVITNFFIDTSSNILDYLQTIVHVLTHGGIWLNFGPLLYHFESAEQTETLCDIDIYTGVKSNIMNNVPLRGLELSAQELLDVATNSLGFDQLEYESGILSGYGLPHTFGNGLPGYNCFYWVLKIRRK